jgi:SAM-dependent methyltransferase
MTRRFNVTNITYCQADILRLNEINERFTLIDCGGVLHHLNDPLRGWRVLVDLLEPDGLMKISLYSWRARSGVRAASEFLRSLQLPRTPAGIRRARRAINDLPEGHPAKAVLVLGDFFTLNGCRDLLMHVQEHQFTLPRITECLDELGLRFLGMEVPVDTKRHFREMFGNDGATVDLEAWDQFEEKYPSTFINMYSFWCCKNEF